MCSDIKKLKWRLEQKCLPLAYWTVEIIFHPPSYTSSRHTFRKQTPKRKGPTIEGRTTFKNFLASFTLHNTKKLKKLNGFKLFDEFVATLQKYLQEHNGIKFYFNVLHFFPINSVIYFVGVSVCKIWSNKKCCSNWFRTNFNLDEIGHFWGRSKAPWKHGGKSDIGF